MMCRSMPYYVHGGIRHLEKEICNVRQANHVHGGIRHLEILKLLSKKYLYVHGGIRHLETNDA